MLASGEELSGTSERWRAESEPPRMSRDPKGASAVCGGVTNGEPSCEFVGVSWTLSGRLRRGGGVGGAIVGEWCKDFDRPILGLVGVSGDSPDELAFRSG